MANRYYWLALVALIVLVVCLARYLHYHELATPTNDYEVLALRYKVASWVCGLGVLLLGFKGWQVDHEE